MQEDANRHNKTEKNELGDYFPLWKRTFEKI